MLQLWELQNWTNFSTDSGAHAPQGQLGNQGSPKFASTCRLQYYTSDWYYTARHILIEGIKTLPFGHYRIDFCRVEYFSWDGDEVEWDYENAQNCAQLLLDSSQSWDNNNSFVVPDTTTSESPKEWETPDPGFAMTSIINEEDIDSDGIVDFDATTSSSSSSPNPFINYEANVCSESNCSYEKRALKVACRQ